MQDNLCDINNKLNIFFFLLVNNNLYITKNVTQEIHEDLEIA